jgi:uncharacterized protein YndB with AHSA1/START domain
MMPSDEERPAMRSRTILMACLAVLPRVGLAEVQQAAPDGALIEHHYHLAVPPAQAWEALVQPERWWPADHTWSGARGNLNLVPAAGGCFCENWDDGSAEHARVVMAMPGKLLRLRGALGPLQGMAVTGVLTVELTPEEGGTEATVTYRISGDPSHRLDGFMAIVDQVVGLQFAGFAGYTGEIGRSAGK